MRKMIILIIVFIGGCLPIFSEIEKCNNKLDQVTPLSQNPGRVIKLKKVMTISDEQGGFFFRMPQDMKIGSDGSIYLKDYYQLLRFNSRGKLLNNYHKEGQGPGEFSFMYSYILSGDTIVVFSSMPNKIIWFDKKGPLVKETRMKEFAFGNLLLSKANKFYFYASGLPLVKGKPKFVDVDYTIFEFSQDGFHHQKLISFPVIEYAMSEGQMRNSYVISEFKARVYRDKYLLITHTPNYLVKIFDIEKKQVVRSFSRRYQRQPWSDKRWEGDAKAPKVEYDNDIQDIFLLENKVWVITSTLQPGKGRLIDIFDYEGNYLDNYYLDLKGNILSVNADCVYVLESTKTDHLIIHKYRLKNKS